MKRLVLFLLTLTATGAAAQGAYDVAALNAFHAEREKILLADDGWFTVAGLHFLNPAITSSARTRSTTSSLNIPTCRNRRGVITMNGTTVTIKAADGQTLNYNGKPAKEGVLHLAEGSKPADTVTYKSTTFFLHYSGPRLAIRVAIRMRRCARTSQG